MATISGFIVFAPDKSKGNDGPGANAEIKDGAYRTRPKEGTIGGPHVATIRPAARMGEPTGRSGNAQRACQSTLPIFGSTLVRPRLQLSQNTICGSPPSGW